MINYRGVQYLSKDIGLVEIRQTVPTLCAIKNWPSILLISQKCKSSNQLEIIKNDYGEKVD